MPFFSIVLTLFLIMDPLGNLSCFRKMLHHYPLRKQLFLTWKEMSFALILMLLFNFIGEGIFELLSLSESVVRISAGTVLFLFALKVLFSAKDCPREFIPTKEEPFLTPLAVPLIASPSLLATIMLFAHIESSIWVMVLAILIAWSFSLAILLLAEPLQKLLGENGLIAVERLMAMVLILLAVQNFLNGITLFFHSHGAV